MSVQDHFNALRLPGGANPLHELSLVDESPAQGIRQGLLELFLARTSRSLERASDPEPDPLFGPCEGKGRSVVDAAPGRLIAKSLQDGVVDQLRQKLHQFVEDQGPTRGRRSPEGSSARLRLQSEGRMRSSHSSTAMSARR
ncbi:MAG: hypothetical protein BGO49_07640 [Planctomycetales bacterium 71-10]|nr:MAG: hypothetical protein BGO49_07640 [Planctomycetales bacterium 71-10]